MGVIQMSNNHQRLQLTDSQVTAFLHLIDVSLTGEKLSDLQQITSKFMETVPFQNLTMLIGPRRRPTWDEICDDLISGIGGLCTARNPFLKALLDNLGYDVYFVSSSMVEPDCHICLIVDINAEKYWVDVGNGYPYTRPYKLGSNTVCHHRFMNYRLRLFDGKWLVEHEFDNSGEWKQNQSFIDQEVPYSFFDHMHVLHYTKPNYGPFLSGLRANRWWDEGGIILRDDTVNDLISNHKINNIFEFKQWIEKIFPRSPINRNQITESAWKTYRSLQMEART